MLQDQSRNRTPMPGAQAPAAPPSDTGPARAEAGIAAMLAKPEPEFVRVSQAALIEALSGDVSAAVRTAIEDHAHALKAGEDEPDHSDETFDRHSARQNETDEHLRSVRCQSLSDLRAKLTYLIPISRPDLLDQRVGDHLEGLLADVDALSRVQAEPPFVLPAQMPAPGSPEAMALHKAVCIEFDRRTQLTDAEYARLKIGDTHTLWTLDTVREVMKGDYSSLLGNEAYAASAATPAELQELLVLTTRREQQFAEALSDLKLHEVHALVFPDDQEEAGGAEGEDPILATIRAHKAAYASWLPHLRSINETPLSDPSYSDLEAAAEAPGNREKEAYEALSEVLPTTLDGLVALADYLPGAVLRNSCTHADDDAMHALGAMCGAVKELVKSGRISSLDKDVHLHSLPPVKTDPIFAALAESRRLYALWQGTYDAWPHGGTEPPAVLARMNAGCGAFMDHLTETVLTTVPTSLTGCTALGRYVLELFERDEIDGDEHGKLGLQAITEGLRALPVKAVAAYPPVQADEMDLARMVVDYFGNEDIDPRLNGDIALRDRARAILSANERLEQRRVDGFMPFPADKPAGLMNIRHAIPAEAQRLLGIAQAEFDRRAACYANRPAAEREAHLKRMRAEYRLDELAAVVSGTPAGHRSSLVEQILASWREYAPHMVGAPESLQVSDEEVERIGDRQQAALVLADKLPATLDSLLPKALALAAIETPELISDSSPRSYYAMNGRLAFDLHTAIVGTAPGAVA